MSTITTPLLPENWYHIYNRGINVEILFFEKRNYDFFLKLLARHVLAVAEIYAYCLLPNHFHMLVRVWSFPKSDLTWDFFSCLIATLRQLTKVMNVREVYSSGHFAASSYNQSNTGRN